MERNTHSSVASTARTAKEAHPSLLTKLIQTGLSELAPSPSGSPLRAFAPYFPTKWIVPRSCHPQCGVCCNRRFSRPGGSTKPGPKCKGSIEFPTAIGVSQPTANKQRHCIRTSTRRNSREAQGIRFWGIIHEGAIDDAAFPDTASLHIQLPQASDSVGVKSTQ